MGSFKVLVLDNLHTSGIEAFTREGIQVDIKGKLKCSDCKHEFPAENIYTPCPKCDSYLSEVIQGKELRVKSIEVD